MARFLKPRDILLFQGDSITDAGRRESPDGLGEGWVAQVAGAVQAKQPDAGFRWLNRGIGGDRTTELLARWKPDCLDLMPSVLTIMIGVNDVWRLAGEWNGQTFVPLEQYTANLRSLVNQALGAGISRLILMSPTAIEDNTNRVLSDHLDERTEAVKALAWDVGAVYVPTRETQKIALQTNPSVKWTSDGCHPTAAGHALIATAWLKAVGA